MVLDVIPARVGLDHFSGRLHLGTVVGQAEARGFVPRAGHDPLPHGAFVTIEFHRFLDILDLAVLSFGLSDLAVLPAVRGQASREPTSPTRGGGWR